MEQVTRAELLEVVYRFYARGMEHDDPGYQATEEHWRQEDAAKRAVVGAPTWIAMLDRLEARHGFVDRQGLLRADTFCPAWSAGIYLPGSRIGFCVCVVGPYYGIRRTGAVGEEAAALDIAREIEATYPGYQPIPPELGDEVLPDVADAVGFGRTTIYHCLLSHLWESLSWPWPPPPRPPLPPPVAPVTRAELFEVVYRFYPRGLTEYDSGYEATEERKRQREAMERAVVEAATWKAMLRRLQARYGWPMDNSLCLWVGAGYYDPAWSGENIPPRTRRRVLRVPARALLRDPAQGRPRRGGGGARSRLGDRSHVPRIPADPAGAGGRGGAGRGLRPWGFGSTTIHQCLLAERWESLAAPAQPLPPPEVPRPGERGSVLDRGDVPHRDDAPDDDPTPGR